MCECDKFADERKRSQKFVKIMLWFTNKCIFISLITYVKVDIWIIIKFSSESYFK